MTLDDLAVGRDGTVVLFSQPEVYRIDPDRPEGGRLAPQQAMQLGTGSYGEARGVSTALDGTLWSTSMTGSGRVGGPTGHPADTTESFLFLGRSQALSLNPTSAALALPEHWGGRLSRAAAVVDGQTVLVGTFDNCVGLHCTDAGGVVWRVTADGAVPVLGREAPATAVKEPGGATAFRITPTNPVQELAAGQAVPVGSVDVGKIYEVVPLTGSRLAVVAGPVVTPALSADLSSDQPGTRRQAYGAAHQPIVLVVDGGQVVRLDAPDLVWDDHPVLSRIDDGHALLTVRWRGLPADQRAFVRIDSATRQVARIGQGGGVWVARPDGRVEVVTQPANTLDQVTLHEIALP